MEFYFDFACPFAYIASTRVEAAASRAGVDVHYIPIVLGGLYLSTNAPQKKTSASTVMSRHKLRAVSADLRSQARRHGVRFAPGRLSPPSRTLPALRAVTGLPLLLRGPAVAALYAACWVGKQDLGDPDVVLAVLAPLGLDLDIAALMENKSVKATLREETDALAAAGAIGVPCFSLPGHDRIVWGGQFLPMVERALGNQGAFLPRYVAPPLVLPDTESKHRVTVTFYFDLGDPFSALAAHMIRQVAAETNARIQYVPIHARSLFEQIGTCLADTVPAKRKLLHASIGLWKDWYGAHDLIVPSKDSFVASMIRPGMEAHHGAIARVTDQTARGLLTHSLFETLWNTPHDDDSSASASSPADLEERALVDGLVEDAVAMGVCGTPSFIVDSDPSTLVWGQDRLNVLADLLARAAHSRNTTPSSKL